MTGTAACTIFQTKFFEFCQRIIFRFSQVDDQVLRLVKKLRDNGIQVFVNALWPAQNAGHDDDRAVELRQPDESWGWLVQQGFKLIQTDRPALLLEYLRVKNLHK